jgi:uncharacterized protein
VSSEELDLTRLRNHFIEEIEIDEIIHFDNEYLKNTEIRSLSDISVKGSITSTTDDLYSLNVTVKGEMVLPCAITLLDVPYPFEIKIDEILNDEDAFEEKYIKLLIILLILCRLYGKIL